MLADASGTDSSSIVGAGEFRVSAGERSRGVRVRTTIPPLGDQATGHRDVPVAQARLDDLVEGGAQRRKQYRGGAGGGGDVGCEAEILDHVLGHAAGGV